MDINRTKITVNCQYCLLFSSCGFLNGIKLKIIKGIRMIHICWFTVFFCKNRLKSILTCQHFLDIDILTSHCPNYPLTSTSTNIWLSVTGCFFCERLGTSRLIVVNSRIGSRGWTREGTKMVDQDIGNNDFFIKFENWINGSFILLRHAKFEFVNRGK